MLRLPFVAVLLFVFHLTAKSTHIVGGEITYSCLGNNQYEVKLSVYRDCFNGVPQFDDPAAFGIYDADFNLVNDIRIDWNQLDDTLDIYLNNPCLTRPPGICVHRTTYTDTIELLPIIGGYNLVYQRCCRNQLIRNIPNPEDVGITIISQIQEAAIKLCNSSPVFNNWPPLAICVHEPIDFDHGATDVNGDSLVYRLCTPLQGATSDMPQPVPPNPGPYAEVNWLPPYGLFNLLGGLPLTIDPVTGFITGVPDMVGNFVVGVCVDEYRNDTLLTTTRRDFQYNVADCGEPVAAYAAPKTLCDSLTVSFTNQTVLNDLGISNWYFDWGGDLSFFSDDYSTSFTYPDTGTYQVALVINPGYSCSDTVFETIHLTRTTVNADFSLDFMGCDSANITVSLNSTSTDPVYGIAGTSWFVAFPDNSNISGSGETFSFDTNIPGTYYVALEASGNNGCSTELTIPFELPFPPGQSTVASYTVCKGESVWLYPNAPADLVYQWNASSDIPDPTIANPLITPDSSATYHLQIIDNELNCTWDRLVDVIVLDNTGVTATATPPQILQGESSQITLDMPVFSSYEWSPSGTLNAANIANPIASPPVTTDYSVTVTATSGCQFTATVRVVVLNPECAEPFIFLPTGFSPNGDGENDMLKMEGRFADEVYWAVYNRWGEKVFEANSLDEYWDGRYRGTLQPAETYGYYYRIRCQDGQVREKKGNLTLIR